MTRGSAGRVWFLRVLALGAAMALALLCVEVLVRVTGRDSPLVWQPDPQLGWRHIPGAATHWVEEGDGHVRINSLGMRDVERTVAKPAGVFRIAVFGDSMTEAVQVDLGQTFTQLLEHRLTQRGLRVEVLNFGVNGYSPLQGYLTYHLVGKAFAPDLVLHAVFTDNDIADCDPGLASGQVGAPFARPDADAGLAIDYSRAEASFSDYHREPIYAVRKLSATYRMLGVLRRTHAGAAAFQAATAAGGGVPKRYEVYLDPLRPRWQEAWNTYERILSVFAQEVRSTGSQFAVISVPAGQVVDERAWNKILSDFPDMRSQQWRLDGPEERIRQLANEHGVLLAEPIEDFRKEAGGAPMFFNGNGHMTPRGHEIMAAALGRFLDMAGLLPASGR